MQNLLIPQVCVLARRSTRFLCLVRGRYRLALYENQNTEPIKLKLAGARLLGQFPTHPIVGVSEYGYLSLFGHVWILSGIPDWASGSRICRLTQLRHLGFRLKYLYLSILYLELGVISVGPKPSKTRD